MPTKEAERKRVARALSGLTGERLTCMFRYFGFQRFEFGAARSVLDDDGEEIQEPPWALVAQCAWVLAGPKRFCLTSAHFGRRGGRRDKFAHPFYRRLADDGPIVRSVTLTLDGVIVVSMTGNYTLTIVPNRRLCDDPEEWRFMVSGETAYQIERHGPHYYWTNEPGEYDPNDSELD
jgi:hypothetical protein